MVETGKWFPIMQPREVAEAGYRAMMRGKTVVIPGAVYKIVASISKALPAAFTARAARKHIEG
jgi:short-subunit dehydrogenase